MESIGMLVGQGQNEASSPAYYDNSAKMIRQPNMKERIELAVRQAEEKLAAVKRARELFDKNPDLEELLNIMQRAHF